MINENLYYDENNYYGEDKKIFSMSEIVESGVNVYYDEKGKLQFVDIRDDGEYTSNKTLKFKEFKSINKTDIEGERIYADYTMVEFECDIFGKQQKRVGVFNYQDFDLHYQIISGALSIRYDKDEIKNIKIVGNTITGEDYE